MVLRSWRFVPVVGLAVLALSLLRADRPASAPKRSAEADGADLAAAFLVTMALLIGVILVLLAAELVTVLQ
jgi:hypothetical protein